MAAAIPEIVGTAAGAGDVAAGGTAGAAAGGAPLAFGGRGGGDDGGSPAAFMVAIVLLGLALIALWLAFHNPAEWDAEGGQWPGLFARILQWMSTHAESPGLLGPLNTSQPAAASTPAAAVAQNANAMTEAQLPGIGPVFATGTIINDIKKLLGL